jgi:hypothetical protein
MKANTSSSCGGPYCARDELEDAFGRVASDRAIETAIDRIEEEGDMWVPSGSRMLPEPEIEP